MLTGIDDNYQLKPHVIQILFPCAVAAAATSFPDHADLADRNLAGRYQ